MCLYIHRYLNMRLERCMKKTMTFFCGLLIIVAALLACGSSSDTNTNTGTVTTPGSNNQAQTSSKHFKVGETVKVGDTWEITVNSVKTSPGNDMSKPQKGQYLLLDVTVKNISNKEQDISSLVMFKLTDDTGV